MDRIIIILLFYFKVHRAPVGVLELRVGKRQSGGNDALLHSQNGDFAHTERHDRGASGAAWDLIRGNQIAAFGYYPFALS